MVFSDRAEAGRRLASELSAFKNKKSVLILAIPRGGVIVGQQLAAFLGSSLDVLISKKIGAPHNPELAIGAVASKAEPVIYEDLAARVGADQAYLEQEIARVKTVVEKQEKFFRSNRPPLDLKEKTVIVTDDGVVTGATVSLALELVRQQNPQKIVLAVPVIAKENLEKIQKLADEVIYLEAPELFLALSQFYQDFEPVTDDQVKQILYNSKQA